MLPMGSTGRHLGDDRKEEVFFPRLVVLLQGQPQQWGSGCRGHRGSGTVGKASLLGFCQLGSASHTPCALSRVHLFLSTPPD